VSSEVSRSRSTFARGYRVTDRRRVPWAKCCTAATAATAAATEGRPVGVACKGAGEFPSVQIHGFDESSRLVPGGPKTRMHRGEASPPAKMPSSLTAKLLLGPLPPTGPHRVHLQGQGRGSPCPALQRFSLPATRASANELNSSLAFCRRMNYLGSHSQQDASLPLSFYYHSTLSPPGLIASAPYMG
jgi:hypothetical protein